MRMLCVLLFRLSLAGWVGVACFFLATVVSLRGSDLFSSDVKLDHPKVLFPLYYAFEFGLLTAAVSCAVAARGASPARGAAFRWAASLAAGALLLAIADYGLVYRPLAVMLVQQPLPPEFAAYHHASRWINALILALSALAAVLAIWPSRVAGNSPGRE